MLIAGRTLQGIGGGGLVTMVEVIMTDMVPLAERGGYWGILALVWTVGSVVGKGFSVLSYNRAHHWRRVCWIRTGAMAMVY
jgi:MFS family permease